MVKKGRYSETEVERLKILHYEYVPPVEIAQLLGRSMESIYYKTWKLGLSKRHIKVPEPPNFKFCRYCEQLLPLSEFQPSNQHRHGVFNICRPCKRKYAREHTADLRERCLIYISGYPPKCKWCEFDDVRALHFDHKNNDKFLKPHDTLLYSKILKTPIDEVRLHLQVLCANCNVLAEWERRRLSFNEARLMRRNRLKILEKLSSGTTKCSSCGCTDIRVLQVDHIHGEGHKDRAKFEVYRWQKYILGLSVEVARSKLQVLCANCNWIKRYKNREHRALVDSEVM